MAEDLSRFSDEELAARIVSADHTAFAALVKRHSARFYACAFRYFGRVEDAEDVVQEAFLKLWQKPQSFDPHKGAKFTTWFTRVVMNLSIDRLRRIKPKMGSDALEFIEDEAARFEERFEMNSEQAILEAAIQALPARQKAALNLCFYEGHSNKEAAQILGVGLKALESLLMRAKKTLKESMKAKGLLD